jgi:hypothetical protein
LAVDAEIGWWECRVFFAPRGLAWSCVMANITAQFSVCGQLKHTGIKVKQEVQAADLSPHHRYPLMLETQVLTMSIKHRNWPDKKGKHNAKAHEDQVTQARPERRRLRQVKN